MAIETDEKSVDHTPLPPFENSLSQLEGIVQELEKGSLPLEKQLNIFEKGVELSKMCLKQLEQMEQKVEILIQNSDGSFKKNHFSQNESGE